MATARSTQPPTQSGQASCRGGRGPFRASAGPRSTTATPTGVASTTEQQPALPARFSVASPCRDFAWGLASPTAHSSHWGYGRGSIADDLSTRTAGGAGHGGLDVSSARRGHHFRIVRSTTSFDIEQNRPRSEPSTVTSTTAPEQARRPRRPTAWESPSHATRAKASSSLQMPTARTRCD